MTAISPRPTTPAGDAPGAGGPPSAPPPPAYPDQHLLTTPFRIPPGMFAKRWILPSTPDDRPGACIDSMVVSYETSDHATGRVLLPFKVHGTDWQSAGCPIQTSSTDRSG